MRILPKLINKLSVGQKVMLVIILEVVSYSIITTIAILQISLVGTEVKQMANLYLPLFSSTDLIRQQVQETRLDFKEVMFVGARVVYDKEAEEIYRAARLRYDDRAQDIQHEITWAENLITREAANEETNPGIIRQYSDVLLQQLAAIRQASRIYNKRVEKIFGHVEDGSFLMGMELENQVALSEGALTEELDRLVAQLQDMKVASVDYAVHVESQASTLTIAASLITVCVVVTVFIVVVKRNISRPMHTLTDAINAFGQQREQDSAAEQALMQRGDELGMLSRSFSRLKRELRSRERAQKAATEEAERANRAKTRFLAAASHDLRQPLHAMQMYIEALRHRLTNKGDLAILADINAVSVSTGRLLNALLDVSQLEAGGVTPQVADFPVEEVIRRVVRAYKPIAYRKNLSVRSVHSGAVVRSDPVLLERVVGNFVSNAVRYTQQGGVLIGCRHRGRSLVIEVWDSGPGIPEEQSQAIYDDFHQLHNKERDPANGLGLGLAIARRLGQCLDHAIQHRSRVGHGSCFSVVVPLGEAASVARDDDPPEAVASGLPAPRVLLIEDDHTVMDATLRIMRTWGYSVVPARSADEALRYVTNGDMVPDIIVADYRLPGDLNGAEVIERVSLKLGRLVPGIIITGDAQTAAMQVVPDIGYRVLCKPVRPAKLRALINHQLLQQGHRRQAEPVG